MSLPACHRMQVASANSSASVAGRTLRLGGMRARQGDLGARCKGLSARNSPGVRRLVAAQSSLHPLHRLRFRLWMLRNLTSSVLEALLSTDYQHVVRGALEAASGASLAYSSRGSFLDRRCQSSGANSVKSRTSPNSCCKAPIGWCEAELRAVRWGCTAAESGSRKSRSEAARSRPGRTSGDSAGAACRRRQPARGRRTSSPSSAQGRKRQGASLQPTFRVPVLPPSADELAGLHQVLRPACAQ